MAFSIQMPNMKLSAQDMGAPDYQQALQDVFKNVQQSYETAYKPKNMAEALLQAQLKNKHDSIINQFLPRSEEARIGSAEANRSARETSNKELAQRLHEALTQKQYANEKSRQEAEFKKNNPLFGLPGAAGQIGSLIYLQQHPEIAQESMNENSYIPNIENPQPPPNKSNFFDLLKQNIITNAQPKNAKLVGPAAEAAALDELGQQHGYDSQVYKDAIELAALKRQERESLTAQRNRRAEGLKSGESWVKDNQGNNIGISRDYSPAEKKEEKGRLFFNTVYPEILNSTSYYSGEGSIRRFENDALNYKNDKNARKRIDDYLTALKIIPAALVKENATTGGANTNQVYNRLVQSLNTSDLPKKVESIIKQYQLPMEAQIRSGQRFSSLLNRATEESKKIPARHTEYLGGKKNGHIYDKKTKKLKQVMVAPENWDAFSRAGGY